MKDKREKFVYRGRAHFYTCIIQEAVLHCGDLSGIFVITK